MLVQAPTLFVFSYSIARMKRFFFSFFGYLSIDLSYRSRSIFATQDPLALLKCLSRHGTFDCGVFCPAFAGRPSRFQLPTSAQLLEETNYTPPNTQSAFIIKDEFIAQNHQEKSSSSSSSPPTSSSLQWQRTLGEVWSALHDTPQQVSHILPRTAVAPNLRSALHYASTLGESEQEQEEQEVHVFVVGSVYLVGDALQLLDFGGGNGAAPGTSCGIN
jgi:hypothetical protein